VPKPSRRSFDELLVENAKLKEQNTQLRRFGAFNGTTKICGDALRVARIVLPWYFIYRAVEAYAGRTSVLDATGTFRVESESFVEAVEKILNAHTLCASFVLIGIAGMVFGYKQIKLRQRNIQHLSPYQQKYERLKDSKRSSSQLSPEGETRPGDE